MISYFDMPIYLFSEQTTEERLGIFPTIGKFVGILISSKGQIRLTCHLAVKTEYTTSKV